MERRFRLLAIAAVLVAVLGCSSKHRFIDLDGGPDASGSDSGQYPSLGTGGAGNTTTGTPNTTTFPTTPAVKCGSTVCGVPGQSLYNLLAGFAGLLGVPLPAGGAGILPTACCTSSNVCGVQANGSCVPRPATDPRCPDVTLLGEVQPGCCLEAQGICGANGAQSGMGCLDVSNPLYTLLGATAPQSCAAPDAGTPDAGAPDAMISMPDDAGQEDASR
jgi:hypothetical protein